MRERPDERYIGQRRVEAGGGNSRRELYHYGARAYLPGVGIFTQPDSIVPNPRNPQALNRYAYVLNNPVKQVDSSGHFAVVPPSLQGGGRVINVTTRAPAVVGGPSVNVGAPSVIPEKLIFVSPSGPPQVLVNRRPELGFPVLIFTTGGSEFPTVAEANSGKLDKALGGTPGDDIQAHHLIPGEFEDHPIVEQAIAAGWDIDGASNGVLLPDNAADALAVGKPVHRGPHSDYSRRVGRELDQLRDEARLSGWDDKRVRQEVEDLAARLRAEVLSEPAGSRLH